MGVFLSGVRWLVLERLWWNEKDPGGGVSIAERQRSELAYQNLVAQFYDFYLFYGNTLIALVVLYFSWAFTAGLHWGLAWAGGALAVAIPVLERSAGNSFERFHARRASLLKEVA